MYIIYRNILIYGFGLGCRGGGVGCECAVGAPGCGWELYWVLHECLVAVREVGKGGGMGEFKAHQAYHLS